VAVVAITLSGAASATPTATRTSTATSTTGATATATTRSTATNTSTPTATTRSTPTPTATTSTIANGLYNVTIQLSSKCVDAAGAATANGTFVQQYTCNTSAAQQWQFTATDSGYYQVGSHNNTAQVWDVSGGTTATADGVKVQLWGYNGG